MGRFSLSGEFTLLSVGLGLLIALVMTAANVYLGLYAGMTVSASIPAAVLGMGAYRLLGRRDILGTNIVQTLASSGESLAAGAIFTIPALVLVGAWQDFKFWPTTLITMSGGLLGIAFMVPLRKLLIVESPQLTYPEGVACAEVLKSGAGGAPGSLAYLVKGFLLGGLFKLGGASGMGGLGLLSGTVEWAGRWGGRVFFAGSDLSPALLSVGFITGLGVAVQVFLGGVIAWVLGLPLLSQPEAMAAGPAPDAAWGLWSTQIRYLGVGAMVVGGLWSIFSIRKGILQGLGSLSVSYRSAKADAKPGRTEARTEENMPGRVLLALLAVCALSTFGLYWYLLKAPGLSLLTTVLMMAAAFLLTGVSSYIVGLVGSSNNPVSGMTISALLGTAGFFLVLGFKGDSAILATLGVAAVVCCAACSAADCSQDLKTGHIDRGHSEIPAVRRNHRSGGAGVRDRARIDLAAPFLCHRRGPQGAAGDAVREPGGRDFRQRPNPLPDGGHRRGVGRGPDRGRRVAQGQGVAIPHASHAGGGGDVPSLHLVGADFPGRLDPVSWATGAIEESSQRRSRGGTGNGKRRHPPEFRPDRGGIHPRGYPGRVRL